MAPCPSGTDLVGTGAPHWASALGRRSSAHGLVPRLRPSTANHVTESRPDARLLGEVCTAVLWGCLGSAGCSRARANERSFAPLGLGSCWALLQAYSGCARGLRGPRTCVLLASALALHEGSKSGLRRVLGPRERFLQAAPWAPGTEHSGASVGHAPQRRHCGSRDAVQEGGGCPAGTAGKWGSRPLWESPRASLTQGRAGLEGAPRVDSSERDAASCWLKGRHGADPGPGP